MNLHKFFKSAIAFMLIIAMTTGMAVSMGGMTKAATTIRVTIHANGGSLESGKKVDSSQMISNSKDYITLPVTIPVRSGYWFAGWGASKSTTIVQYYPGQRVTSSMSLYAIWIRQNGIYQITYNSNGGTYIGKYDDNCKQYWQYVGAGQKVSLIKNKFTAPNRKFGGWSTTPGGVVKYRDGQTITATSKLTLYPRWKVQVEIHTMLAQPSTNGNGRKTEFKDSKTKEWKYEKNPIKDEIELPEGYYYGDKDGKEISENTLCTIGLAVYLWPCRDEITLQWAGTSKTMYVYTGLSLASSYSKDSMKYPLSDRFKVNDIPQLIIGWRLNGGAMKNQIVTPGYRMICHGKNYTADVVTCEKETTEVIHISGAELKALYDLTNEKWLSQKPSEKDTVVDVTTQTVLYFVGIGGGRFSQLIGGVYGGLTGIASAIKNGYYNDTEKKTALATLRGNLAALVGHYCEELYSWKDYKVFFKCHVEKIDGKCELIADSVTT